MNNIFVHSFRYRLGFQYVSSSQKKNWTFDRFNSSLSSSLLISTSTETQKGCLNCTREFGTKKNSNNMKNNKLSQSSRKWLTRQQKDQYAKKAKKDGSPSRAIFKLEEIAKYINNHQSRKKLKLSSKEQAKEAKKFKFLQPKDIVVDLGAAPGGWSLFASRKIGKAGILIAVDLLQLDSNTINSINGTSNSSKKSSCQFHTIQGDFTNNNVKEEIIRLSNGNQVDSIISDMAANFTGDKMTDALRTLNLCEEAMMFAAGPNCFDELESDSNEKFDVDNNNSSSSNNDNNDVHNAGLLRHGGSFLCKFFACGKDDEEDLMNAAKSRFEFCTVIKPPASRKESAELYLFATGYKGL